MANGSHVKWTKPNGIDQYKSVNTFIPSTRQENYAFELMAFYIDIDFKDVGIQLNKNYDPQFVYDYVDKVCVRCEQLNINYPTRINFSGNGLHVYWKIKTVNDCDEYGNPYYGAFAKACLKIYKLIEQELINQFEDLGADNNCKNITRVLRIENTINSKNGNECKCVFSNKNNEVSIADMADALLVYSKQEVIDFKNQPTTDHQKNLAQKIGLDKISEYKLVAQNQIKEFIASNKKQLSYDNKLSTKANGKDYIINFLENAFNQGLIIRGKGITNNFFYLLGIASKRINNQSDYYLTKYLDKLNVKGSERNEFRTTFNSGLNANGYYLNVSYGKMFQMLKIDNKKIFNQLKRVNKKSRTTKKIRFKVYQTLKTNKKYLLSKSNRKIAKVFNISKDLASKIKQEVINDLRLENNSRSIKKMIEVVRLNNKKYDTVIKLNNPVEITLDIEKKIVAVNFKNQQKLTSTLDFKQNNNNIYNICKTIKENYE